MFDPDKYLAEKSKPVSSGFDPDAYLKDKGIAPQAPKEPIQYGKAQTALEGFGNQASMGYLPQLQAKAAPLIYKGLNALTGKNVEPDSYVEERDANIKRMGQEEEQNPKSAMAGKAAGLVTSAVATPLPEVGMLKGAGLLKGAAKGAIYGAGTGAVANPGDVEGKVDPTQLEQREENAKTGAKFGAVAGAATHMISKGFSGLKNSADKAQEIANAQAIKTSGADLKSVRSLMGKGKLDDIGQFALDNKIVAAGDKVEDVAKKADSFRKNAGKKLDEIYTHAQQSLPEGTQVRGFNPVADRSEIMSSVENKVGDSPNKSSALKHAESYLDQLASDHGDNILNPKVANNIKTELDKSINYNRNPQAPNKAAEEAYSAMRDYVSNKVSQHIEDVGSATGSPDLASKLSKANREYGFSKQLHNMAEDRVNRHLANKHFGLTDTIAGAGGGAVGAALSTGGDIKHQAGGTIGGAVLGALAHKYGNAYGPGLLAGAANTAAKMAPYSTVPLGQIGAQIPNGLLTKSAIQNRMVKRQ